MTEVLTLALIGGLVAVDNVSAIQSMVSRPLPAAFLTGLALGVPLEATLVGAFLELFLLVAVPAGGGRMPEGGLAAVVAAAVVSLAPGPGGLALGTAGGLIWGLVAGWTQTALRHWNGTRVPLPSEGPVTGEAITLAIVGGLTRDFLRGAVLSALGLVMARLTVPLVAPAWPLDQEQTGGLLLVGGMVSLGVLLRAQDHLRRAFVLFGVGLILGSVAWGGVPWP